MVHPSSSASRPKVVLPPAGTSVETALAADAKYRDLVEERSRLAVKNEKIDKLEAGVLQRIAANARDLAQSECDVEGNERADALVKQANGWRAKQHDTLGLRAEHLFGLPSKTLQSAANCWVITG
ncbi:hypothetical protein N7520_003870 [Penicillium odoratum]|uniref:uncharacterized protein n=1 Tax=Penicillium odoratum TaxID=1167516 RepID=UPI002546EE56|nr:uncharacterized protein N7520_003870 [Penicillium odoratum]KAJ5769311.1 hypothetical protein N7520_003870 [Penicillium odoratum]